MNCLLRLVELPACLSWVCRTSSPLSSFLGLLVCGLLASFFSIFLAKRPRRLLPSPPILPAPDSVLSGPFPLQVPVSGGWPWIAGGTWLVGRYGHAVDQKQTSAPGLFLPALEQICLPAQERNNLLHGRLNIGLLCSALMIQDCFCRNSLDKFLEVCYSTKITERNLCLQQPPPGGVFS